MSAMKSLLHGAFSCVLAACAVQAQNTGSPPTAQLDFSKDPCGNPLVESQLWISIHGNVSQVLDDHTILLALAEAPKTLRVHLAGISSASGALAKQAKAHLQELLRDKAVDVLVNPEVWDDEKKRPNQLTGVVHLSEGIPSDVGSILLADGWVRFKNPRPYTMSNYTTCRYRRAEADAQSKKLGVWR